MKNARSRTPPSHQPRRWGTRLGRLAGANKNSGAEVYSYAYDRFGNRWQQNGPHTMSLSFGGNNNRMDGYTYDAAGNLLNDGTHTYAYDAENQLISVDGGSTASYVYDADGLRVRKATASGTVDFLRDLDGNEVAEVPLGGSWSRAEVYAGGQHLATYSGGVSGTTYFNFSDWLETERTRANMAGSATQTCASLPFGDWLTCSGTDSSPMHFTGYERDGESGLDYASARHYISRMGRFASPDPLGGDITNPQSLNRYAYVMNNPINFIDPTGMWCQSWNPFSRGNEYDDFTCTQNGGIWIDDDPWSWIGEYGTIPWCWWVCGGGGGGWGGGGGGGTGGPPIGSEPMPDPFGGVDANAFIQAVPPQVIDQGIQALIRLTVWGLAIYESARLAVSQIRIRPISLSRGIPRDRIDGIPRIDQLQKGCTPGQKLTYPATGRAYRGGIVEEQEYICSHGIFTIQTITVGGRVVHQHVRPGRPKAGGA